jgi:hypothetical protein
MVTNSVKNRKNLRVNKIFEHTDGNVNVFFFWVKKEKEKVGEV